MTTPYFNYQVVRDFIKGDSNLDEKYADAEYSPGPPSYEGVADTVGRAVVITVGGGPGFILEQQFDAVLVALDIAGDQNDPDDAIEFARQVDRRVCSLVSTQTIGGMRVLSVLRAGGRPTPTGVDDGDRWHLACSYVWRVQSGA